MFYKTINLKRRQEMINFLANHFRYYSMNSWNRATSYSNCVKLTHIPNLPDNAFEILEQGDVFDEINWLINNWSEKYDYLWQAGFNGRSSGYIVLYQGGKRETDYKTRCDSCGRLTWYEEDQKCHVDGCEGTLKKLKEKHYQIFSYPGKGLDEERDFNNWDNYSLQERTKLVRDFDRLCDTCINTFINCCNTYIVKEKTIRVPKKIKVLVEKEIEEINNAEQISV